MDALERNLRSCGKECFVDNFEKFKNCKDKLAKELFAEDTKRKSLAAQMTRINAAARIFNEKFEYNALQRITESKRISRKTILKAEELMKHMEK